MTVFFVSRNRKIAAAWILLGTFVGIPVLLVIVSIGLSAFQARRPRDMPLTSIWIDAPAVPFGFYRGWWQGCWVEADQRANHCRLYGPGLPQPVVYEGRFMPCGQNSPVPANELKLRPPSNRESMWLFPRFVVFLQDGRVLVPVESLQACPKFVLGRQSSRAFARTPGGGVRSAGGADVLRVRMRLTG